MRRALHSAGFAMLTLWIAAPLLPLLIWAFAGRWVYPALVPQDFTLRAWDQAAAPQQQVLAATGTSLGLALTTAVTATVLGALAARGLVLYRPPAAGLVRLLLLAPVLVPPFALAVGVQEVFVRVGLSDQSAGVALVHLVPALPYTVLVMIGATPPTTCAWSRPPAPSVRPEALFSATSPCPHSPRPCWLRRPWPSWSPGVST